jgi:hypothetical protein
MWRWVNVQVVFDDAKDLTGICTTIRNFSRTTRPTTQYHNPNDFILMSRCFLLQIETGMGLNICSLSLTISPYPLVIWRILQVIDMTSHFLDGKISGK